MKYVPIPIEMLPVGQALPINIVSDSGQLLLRKGQPIVSMAHREKLHGFQASATPSDADAWQRAYERHVHELLRSGVDVREVAKAPMPTEIRESDYVVGQQLHGGWLDLQEVLRGILYQGGLAINPLHRLVSIERKAHQLLMHDPDDSLFCLFQALTDDSIGYCATHALLCAVVADLTAARLNLDKLQRRSLFAAALTMNIGMAREQDCMARQHGPLSDWQRNLIAQHPERSVAILSAFGVDDADQLDLVRWHHDPTHSDGVQRNLLLRRILNLTDTFVARTAARKSRSSQSAVRAVKSMVIDAAQDTLGVGSAMAQAVGFYPPGTYVQLFNGDVAVSIKRGPRANTPWVVPISAVDGMPIGKYQAQETQEPARVITAPVNFEKVRVTVNLERIRKARERIG